MITTDTEVEIQSMQTFTRSSKSQTVFKANMVIYPAVILHPSLGCPLIVDENGPVSIFIVTDSTFRSTFIKGNGGMKDIRATGGENVAISISQHLKIIEWDEATETKKNIAEKDEPISKNRVKKENITCTYLGILGESSPLGVSQLGVEIKNAAGLHIANIRTSVIDRFKCFCEKDEKLISNRKYFNNDGMRYLFQIDLDMPLVSGNLYDSFWVLRNLSPQKSDFDQKHLDIQDRLARDYIQSGYYKYAKKDGPEYAFKVTDKGIELTPDTTTPIQNRHPIYVPPAGKNKLTIGHLSDIHVSSRQNAFKGRSATVIPGVEETISPFIGDQANNNCDNFFDLLNQFGHKTEGVDLLVITGDLYDHLHNYDPAFKRTAKTSRPDSTGQLWEAMYFEEKPAAVHQRNDEYPCGIDALMVYSLIIHYYNTYKKPVFMTSGNHEAYGYPYGISPRLYGERANAGIPLDHNLTFYEAILLYGPGYSKIVKKINFAADNLDWFYNIFTPLTDCLIRYGDQCLIGLGWGDDEDISTGAAISEATNLLNDKTGTLPRANKSVNLAQRRLVESALAQQSLENIFCSHFTLVNYDMETPLAEEGKIIGGSSTSQYEHGTVIEGRMKLHGAWLSHSLFQFALSGHSHRIGLYKCRYTSTTLTPGFLQTTGYHPDSTATQKVTWEKKTKVLVSASAGPIPKQNLNGEMCGTGMELPSGSRINPDGSIVLTKCRVQTARPRFCVACDYIDVLKDGFWEYFRAVGNDGTFEMKPYWQKIHPRLSENTKAEMIESVTMYVVGSKGTNPLTAKKVKKADNKILFGDAVRWEFEVDLTSDLEFYGKNSPTMFLSLKFNSSAFKGLPGFDHYDFTSPWNIQIEIFNKVYEDGLQEMALSSQLTSGFSGSYEVTYQKKALNKRKNENRLEDLAIRRHEKFGEEPSFKWRNRKSKREYTCDLELKH